MHHIHRPDRQVTAIAVAQVAPMRGVINAMLLSAAIWVAIGWSFALLP